MPHANPLLLERLASLSPEVGPEHYLMRFQMARQHQAHSHPRSLWSVSTVFEAGVLGAGRPGRMPYPCWQHAPAATVSLSSKSTCPSCGLVCGLCWLQQQMKAQVMRKEQRYCVPLSMLPWSIGSKSWFVRSSESAL